MERCSDCRKWLNHYECRHEKLGLDGTWRGPAMDSLPCGDYEPKNPNLEEAKNHVDNMLDK